MRAVVFRFACAGYVIAMFALAYPGWASPQIRFVNSVTGFAVEPEGVSIVAHGEGAVERRLDAAQIKQLGAAGLQVEAGAHRVTVAAPKYNPMSANVFVSEESPYNFRFLLDPVLEPKEV